MPAKGPPLDWVPADGQYPPIRMYDDVYVPTEWDIQEHLRLHGLPAIPPVKAPPHVDRNVEEAREAERQAQVEEEFQRRAEARVLEMLDPSGDIRRGLLEGDPWQEAPLEEAPTGASEEEESP